MSHLVGNPEDRFSHNKAHIISTVKIKVPIILYSRAADLHLCHNIDRFSNGTRELRLITDLINALFSNEYALQSISQVSFLFCSVVSLVVSQAPHIILGGTLNTPHL